MDETLVETLWDELFDHVGADMRTVTRYSPTDYATKMREDVRASYTADEDRELLTGTIVTQLLLDDSKEVYNVGDLDAFVSVFDEAWVLVRPDTRNSKTGTLVSIQRDGASATMNDLDWCLQYLDAELPGLLDESGENR